MYDVLVLTVIVSSTCSVRGFKLYCMLLNSDVVYILYSMINCGKLGGGVVCMFW
jgi:hypothetical protein